MIKLFKFAGGFVIVAAVLCSPSARGQGLRTRFPQPAATTTTGAAGTGLSAGAGSTAPSSGGASNLTPITPAPYSAYSGGNVLGPPSFDPYSTAPSGTMSSSPSLLSSPAGGAYAGSTVGGAPAAQAYGPAYPSATPPAVFPNGVAPLPTPQIWPTDPGAGQIQWGAPLRFIIGPRLRHTWLHGGDNMRDLDINDSEIGVAFAFPNFLFSSQPLYVVPTFGLHLWSGPQFGPPPDLPARAYDGYIDFGWMTDPARPFGVELGARAGVFTDFDTFTTKSFRVQGQGYGRVRFTPTLEARFGVMWIDRAQIKLLPAGGLIWTPNPRARYEIDFPSPKLAHYLLTVGTHDIWWYIAGEYGGGTWTIQRADATSDRIDINDIRLMVGLETGPPEFMRQGRRVLFFEAGWVTDRDVIYVANPQDNFSPRDTFMVRAGLYY